MYAEQRTMKMYWMLILMPWACWMLGCTGFLFGCDLLGIPMWAGIGMCAVLAIYMVLISGMVFVKMRHEYLTAYYIFKNGLSDLRKALWEEWDALWQPYPLLRQKREWLEAALKAQCECTSEHLAAWIEDLQTEIARIDQEILLRKKEIWANALPFRQYIPEGFVPERFLLEPT